MCIDGQAKKRMAKLIQRIIRDKRAGRLTGAGTEETAGPRDAIDVLIGDGSHELTDELISDNMIDLMIPAEDSVPVLITLAVKFLSECPLALQQLEVIKACSCTYHSARLITSNLVSKFTSK